MYLHLFAFGVTSKVPRFHVTQHLSYGLGGIFIADNAHVPADLGQFLGGLMKGYFAIAHVKRNGF